MKREPLPGAVAEAAEVERHELPEQPEPCGAVVQVGGYADVLLELRRPLIRLAPESDHRLGQCHVSGVHTRSS